MCIEAHRLYVSPMDWDSVDYAALVLQAGAGEYCHYGLAYGCACWLKGQPGGFARLDEEAAYDLNLLCFDAAFVPAEDAARVRRLAAGFAADYVDSHGLEDCLNLLAASGTEAGAAEVASAIGDWCAGHGVDVEPSALRVGHGGVAYAYRVRGRYAEYLVGREWQDANWQLNPLVTEHFLHEDYAAARAFFEVNEAQMASYQALFDLGPYDDSLRVILPNPLQSLRTSVYQSGTHRILLLNVDSLMHEYIHALARPTARMELWEAEGFARYFSYRYDAYGLALLNEDYNHPGDGETTRYVRDYLQAVGRPIDMAADHGALEDLNVYRQGYRSPNASYAAGASYVKYLVERFGETAVIQQIYGSAKTIKIPQALLVSQWLDAVNESCQKYDQSSDR